MSTLLGRESERRELEELMLAARNGRSSAVVVRGAAGIGKTALLATLDGRLPRCVVLSGIEAESAMAFAGLHRILAHLPDVGSQLAPPQRAALDVALGRAAGDPPDRFLVGLGTLSWLAALAEGGLLLIVDDAHWLDQESADVLAFVARRLNAEGVVAVFAERDESPTRFAGLPELALEGLDSRSAVALLLAHAAVPPEGRVAESIVEATAGNPLAIIDLGQELSDAQLSGRTTLTPPLPLGSHLEDHYARRVAEYPSATREWLLVAAAEPWGSAAVVAHASEILGIPSGAADPPEAERLVTLTPDISFRHALVRSAIYASAPFGERRRVHLALAQVAYHLGDSGLRTWHLAAASSGHDSAVADLLEREAQLSGERGGYAARARLLSRARELSPPGADRTRRTIDTAEASFIAGAPGSALALLDELDPGELADVDRGRMTLVRVGAELYLGVSGAMRRMAARQLDAALAFEHSAPERAVDALLAAWQSAISAEWMLEGTTLADIATASTRIATGTDAASLLLLGLSHLASDPISKAAPHLRAALDALDSEASPGLLARHGQLSVALGAALWDDEGRDRVMRRSLAQALRIGALSNVDITLWTLSLCDTILGRLSEAQRAIERVYELRGAIGLNPDQQEVFPNVELLAWQGTVDNLRERIDRSAEAAVALGLGAAQSVARTSHMILDLAARDYEPAYQVASAIRDEGIMQIPLRALPDLVEAAARTGRTAEALAAVERMAQVAHASGTNWAAGVLARSRAIVAETGSPDDVDAYYGEAIAALSATLARADLARSHLLYGEWLRRQLRRRDARAQLLAGLELFEDMGAERWAQRARQELAALGEFPEGRPARGAPLLTAQEAAVARLAVQGWTNADIAASLYISTNTVAYHLKKVFRKLGVTSRRRLREVLADEA